MGQIYPTATLSFSLLILQIAGKLAASVAKIQCAAARHMREENAVPERPLDRRIRLWLSHARHGSCDATIDRQVRVDTGLNEY